MAISKEQAVKEWLIRNRFALLALVITISTWLTISYWVPTKYLDLLAYWALGWWFLGGICVPWVEANLTKLFGDGNGAR